MQEGVKQQPWLVIKLRATFLKLASSLDLPLLRITQGNSKDLLSVSQYYSGELVGYFRKVLQIIPKSMFGILSKIINIQTQKIPELPTRLEKEKMKEYSQLDARYEVARLTHEISVFTEGMLMMKTTLVGVIKIDPKQLLEDGIRKELVYRIASSIHNILIFNPKSKVNELYPKLAQLLKTMSGFKRSFEYIQDYVNIYGLKIWQEEIMRIINYNVEQECNSFLRQKVQDYESIYQSKNIPIPRFHPVDTSITFIGRLARELLRLTDARTTIYVDSMNTWYDSKTKQEILDKTIFQKILAALGTYGLSGLDRLYRFMVVRELQNFISTIRQLLNNKDKIFRESLNTLSKNLHSIHRNLIEAPIKTYVPMVQKFQKVWQGLVESVVKIGQIQIISGKICSELNFSCKFHSKAVYSGLKIMNKSLLTAIEKHYEDPKNPYPNQDNPMMFELTNFLDLAGMDDPLAKIYITTKPVQDLALLCFLVTIAYLQKVQYSKALDGLICKRVGDGVDSHPFVIGILTLLRQFHSIETNRYLEYLCQYISSYLGPSFVWSAKTTDLPQEVINGCFFLENLLFLGKIDKKVIESFIPSFTIAEFRKIIN